MPASRLVVVKEFSRANAESRLSMLRQVLDSYFVSCIEIFHFEDRLYMISEHMTMSLLQIESPLSCEIKDIDNISEMID